MRKVENWSETKMKQSENEIEKEAKTAVIFASKLDEAKLKRNFFRFDAKKVFENEIKRKKR